jgi:hypothetical protein
MTTTSIKLASRLTAPPKFYLNINLPIYEWNNLLQNLLSSLKDMRLTNIKIKDNHSYDICDLKFWSNKLFFVGKLYSFFFLKFEVIFKFFNIDFNMCRCVLKIKTKNKNIRKIMCWCEQISKTLYLIFFLITSLIWFGGFSLIPIAVTGDRIVIFSIKFNANNHRTN